MKSLLASLCFAAAILAGFLAGCSKPGGTDAEEAGDRGPEEAVAAMATGEPTSSSDIQSRPLAPRQSGRSDRLFRNVPSAESGLDFIHRWEPRNALEQKQIATAFAGGAVALGDVDDDGLPEILLTRPQGGSRLYRNLGGLKFEDMTVEAGIEAALKDHWAAGATFVDLQGDGHLDLYVCGYGCPNKLFVNRGDGRFEERAAAHGLAFSGASIMMSFVDYDRDGDLDAHLLTNRLSGGDRPEGIEFRIVDGEVIAPEPYRDEVGAVVKPDGSLHPFDAGQADHLYRNDGGQFTDVAADAGLKGHSQGLSATWWDFDSDGWVDLFVANDFFGPDHLYHNQHDGTFRDIIADAVPNTPWFSMGSDAGDLDNDGRLDLIVADMAGTTHYKQKVNMGDMDAEGWFLETPTPRQYMRNAVYINTGTPRFLEVAHMTGLAATDWTWAVKIADFDSDGRNDVFFSNGMTRPFFHADVRKEVRAIAERTGENRWSDYPPLEERNLLFQNRGSLTFVEVSREWGIDEESVSFGAAGGDLDGDGDVDLIINDFQKTAALFENTSTSGHLLKVSLRGGGTNPHAIGAEIRIETQAGRQIRLMQPVRGFYGCDPAEVIFGLGEESSLKTLNIRWPSGEEQTVNGLEAGRHYVIAEADEASPIEVPPAPDTLFVEYSMPNPPRHAERDFDDFAIQPLLPNKLSLLGPAMAWGDLDGNGKVDCFLGGAYGHAAQLWLQSGEGKWFLQRVPFFENDALREDVDAALFDADGDGDLDLYVVSGGVEGRDFQDRLYLSVENGLSTAPEGALPDMNFSGSCVAVGDLEGDGDPDLFVGARVIPGKYPTSTASRLLINDGSGRFSDSTAAVLAEAGMVTDAVWADTDGDRDLDLVVTTEYGPIRCYRNDGGNLVETDVGLSEYRGWWNVIAAADVDADGDIDFAVGNFGWNTKYHPTREQPQLLYYGDFEGSGQFHCVEAHVDGNMMVPNRGLSCSSAAMDFIAKRFNTFHDFALADLAGIYSAPKLARALRLEAHELASGLLVNRGDGTFEFKALPRLAQIAPSFGLVFLEADGDGKIDLYVSQNFYGPQRETGRMAGGVGLLLLGNGDATFRGVEPARSGIVVAGDARSVVAVDFDGNGKEDLAVAVNNGAVRLFRSLCP